MLEDYTKYLSVDNGHGVLISKDDAYLLDKYHIDYYSCFSLKELIQQIENCIDDEYDEELELVLEHLNETYYYQNVHK